MVFPGFKACANNAWEPGEKHKKNRQKRGAYARSPQDLYQINEMYGDHYDILNESLWIV